MSSGQPSAQERPHRQPYPPHSWLSVLVARRPAQGNPPRCQPRLPRRPHSRNRSTGFLPQKSAPRGQGLPPKSKSEARELSQARKRSSVNNAAQGKPHLPLSASHLLSLLCNLLLIVVCAVLLCCCAGASKQMEFAHTWLTGEQRQMDGAGVRPRQMELGGGGKARRGHLLPQHSRKVSPSFRSVHPACCRCCVTCCSLSSVLCCCVAAQVQANRWNSHTPANGRPPR
jgi:hypothetical protein